MASPVKIKWTEEAQVELFTWLKDIKEINWENHKEIKSTLWCEEFVENNEASIICTELFGDKRVMNEVQKMMLNLSKLNDGTHKKTKNHHFYLFFHPSEEQDSKPTNNDCLHLLIKINADLVEFNRRTEQQFDALFGRMDDISERLEKLEKPKSKTFKPKAEEAAKPAAMEG